jgi:hypothetical protein
VRTPKNLHKKHFLAIGTPREKAKFLLGEACRIFFLDPRPSNCLQKLGRSQKVLHLAIYAGLSMA